MAEQLGLGPTLFLLTTKAFAYFFMVLTIINIPVMLFFATGNTEKLSSPTDLFAYLSMGNVGQSGFSCNQINPLELLGQNPAELGYNAREQLDENKRKNMLSINCGIGSNIKSLIYIGFSKDDQSNCKRIL